MLGFVDKIRLRFMTLAGTNCTQVSLIHVSVCDIATNTRVSAS